MKRLGAALCAAVFLLAACSGDDDDGAALGSADAGELEAKLVDLRAEAEGERYPEVDVSVKDNEFIAPAIRIAPGTTVAWHNEGRSAHDLISVDEPGDESAGFGVDRTDFEPGDDYEFRFDEPGTYRYWCSLHGSATKGMVGLVVVGDGKVDAAGSDGRGGTVSGTLRVPDDYPTIQAAVDAAAPGSLVLIDPGVYTEAVTVTTDDLVIRGLDRNTTILDGEFKRDNGFKVLADGVAIENLTAQNFELNGFFWTGVSGYRGSYLNAIRNGDYAIYAFDSVKGQFDHDYGSGSPDAAYYIGQCYPCDAVLSDSIGEWNGLGYSGTNAGGNLLIVNSRFNDNRAGIVPNSGTGEANPPERETTIVGNTVYSNNNAATAAINIAGTAGGNGILLAGGLDNVVERNLVYDHDSFGIGVIPLPEKALEPDNEVAQNFDARGNAVRGNVLRDNRAYDLALITSIDDNTDTGDNCFEGNTYTSSLPDQLETLAPCGAAASSAFATDINRFLALFGGEKPPGADYKTVALPDPGEQPQMPNAKTTKPRPASKGVPARVDLTKITVPTG